MTITIISLNPNQIFLRAFPFPDLWQRQYFVVKLFALDVHYFTTAVISAPSSEMEIYTIVKQQES
jgi:hypothetical protein